MDLQEHQPNSKQRISSELLNPTRNLISNIYVKQACDISFTKDINNVKMQKKLSLYIVLVVNDNCHKWEAMYSSVHSECHI